MMSTKAPVQVYGEKIREIDAQLKGLVKKRNIIAWARFACIILTIGSFYYMLPSGLGTAFLIALIFVAIFLRLVIVAANNNEKIGNLERLKKINEDEIRIANGVYYDRKDGTELLPALHDYAHDLDIFGTASLYQYINRTTSQKGNQRFGQWLLNPANAETILARQEAVKELSTTYEWRQQLEAHGLAEHIKAATEERLGNWVQGNNRFINKTHWKWLRFVLPGIICGALLLNIAGVLASPLFYGMVFIFLLISGSISKRIMPDYLQLDKIVSEINTLKKSIEWIESKSFQSPLLKNLQLAYTTGNTKASGEVKALKGILDRMDIRLNPLIFIPLNIFFFWDLQQMIALEKWKVRNKATLVQWFESLADFEALSSLANVYFNHPHWAFPKIDNKDGSFVASDLGHPLIAEDKRVNSSFSTTGKPQIALITGSNMAGKSTFLRSVGINIVLAMAEIGRAHV